MALDCLLQRAARLPRPDLIYAGTKKGMCCMRALSIEAGLLPGAHGLYSALSEFHPELAGDDDEGYRLTVELGGDDARTVAVLEAIQAHVIARDNGPALVELEGYRYTFHAR